MERNVQEKLNSREIQAQKTERRLFEAAIELIRGNGYHNVTVDDITKFAGVSKGTFYLYFDTKDAVLEEQFKYLDNHYAHTAEHLPDAPVDAQLLYFLDQMCEYCRDVCGLNIMKTLYMNQISTELRVKLLNNKDRVFYKIMSDFVARGRGSGVFRTDMDVDEMMNLIIRSVHGLIYDWCLYDAEFDIVEECTRYFRNIFTIIKTAP